MIRLFIVLLIAISFNGCASKTYTQKFITLPHYTEDKANLYLINNETEIGSHVEYIYKIESKNFNKEILICYNQYSYTALDEGHYIISAVQKDKNHAFGSREDNENDWGILKKGEIYIFKTDTSYDVISVGKFLGSSIFNNPIAPKIKIVRLQTDETIVALNNMAQFTNFFGIRPYPLIAEENTDTCTKMALKNTF
ncbi:hypothetical protein ACNSOO_04545 [Aliarcobacter lanthieri]|uniref:hypothetical protein n=1 Tax=Aliarcobacter lanthieri TaxID=1355374 RepID=UPI003AADB048